MKSGPLRQSIAPLKRHLTIRHDKSKELLRDAQIPSTLDECTTLKEDAQGSVNLLKSSINKIQEKDSEWLSLLNNIVDDQQTYDAESAEYETSANQPGGYAEMMLDAEVTMTELETLIRKIDRRITSLLNPQLQMAPPPLLVSGTPGQAPTSGVRADNAGVQHGSGQHSSAPDLHHQNADHQGPQDGSIVYRSAPGSIHENNPDAGFNGNHRAPNAAKLPKIDLPKFDGNIFKWQEFWTLFSENVHNQPNLSAVTKLSYLKPLLRGSAADACDGFTTDEKGYIEIVETLKIGRASCRERV